MVRRILVLLLVLSLAMLTGCGKQTQAVGTGELPPPAEVAGTLMIENAAIADCSNSVSKIYFAFAWLENTSDQVCRSDSAVLTLYDESGNVVSSSPLTVAPVYPPGRWLASNPIINPAGIPARVQLAINHIEWDDVDEAVRFETIQATYAPGRYEAKVVGQFSYEGPGMAGITVRPILFDASGVPIGTAAVELRDITPGIHPFEAEVNPMPHSPVASVELAFILP